MLSLMFMEGLLVAYRFLEDIFFLDVVGCKKLVKVYRFEKITKL
jgi:hypothetical protein